MKNEASPSFRRFISRSVKTVQVHSSCQKPPSSAWLTQSIDVSEAVRTLRIPINQDLFSLPLIKHAILIERDQDLFASDHSSRPPASATHRKPSLTHSDAVPQHHAHPTPLDEFYSFAESNTIYPASKIIIANNTMTASNPSQSTKDYREPKSTLHSLMLRLPVSALDNLVGFLKLDYHEQTQFEPNSWLYVMVASGGGLHINPGDMYILSAHLNSVLDAGKAPSLRSLLTMCRLSFSIPPDPSSVACPRFS